MLYQIRDFSCLKWPRAWAITKERDSYHFSTFLTRKVRFHHCDCYLHSGVCMCVYFYSLCLKVHFQATFTRKLSHISARGKYLLKNALHSIKLSLAKKQLMLFCSRSTNHLLGFPGRNRWMPSTKRKQEKVLARLHAIESWNAQVWMTIQSTPCKIKVRFTGYLISCSLLIYLKK